MTNEQLAEAAKLTAEFRKAVKEWDDAIPANGSYAVEDLTQFIDSHGGPICNAMDALIAEVRRLQAVEAILADPAAVHINILRGMIPLSRMNALHIAGATDYDAIKAEVRRLQDENEALRGEIKLRKFE